MKGFTLIELLVAMGIMAVLTGMALFNFNQSRVRARDVQRKNDLKQLQTALEVYKNDNNFYPSDPAAYQTDLITGSYIKNTFNDPKGSAEWVDYQYLPSVDLKYYYLTSCLENLADSSKASEALCAEAGVMCVCGVNGSLFIVSQP
ncbi:MAG: PilE-like protein [Candidatus Collierbacteria bacterium GW2011_GWB1_45_35]|uniref:PilE-like protein n=2 Tax=Candidatus Collieribacteriota TaxID=1752725 RepID=A0A0G1MWW3_9BACT|nr:MAG: PilE-like protein [Microgenomates group bacterium GW2011_GWC1_44_23]KKT85262.1 MAG: PilE-like protein [Candidatus Collierbacteria bacterium GW2011_GWA2_44_99]KKT95402.1 MAG: PilE-like protein [Candidatus Collierbacteria bacterium GW2011_GWA1_45_15]KKU00052.1 MAG: PilE-like protein [Candidatus Collierbacteria bacterium GW2011_GWB2_45_17]KKU05151.1 MAG: PilE-like protein [Candidatus Collierbacteria bacterium GW2011_GWB1_45_35]KKU08420.1 MAG: PilE-like protein [Candidatus Collierbacteria 